MGKEIYKQKEVLRNNIGIINPNDADFKNLYVTQDWVNAESVASSQSFFLLALGEGILQPSEVFTLGKQKVVFQLTGVSEYMPPVVLPFIRKNSKNEYVQCYAIGDGHHRICMSRLLGIPLEVKIDWSFGNIDVGQPKNLNELNQRLCTYTGGIVGGSYNSLKLSRILYKDISLCLSRQEP